ncbi:MAG: O-antigen ligase family protein [Actinomycetes bacterium]
MSKSSKVAKAIADPGVPWQVHTIAYLTLGLVVFGDALFAQEYLLLTLPWLLWYGLGAIGLSGAIYFLAKAQWRRVLNQVPIEMTLILALMIGSSFWSSYPSQTITSFLLEVSLVVIAIFFVAIFNWRQILNIFANTIRVIIIGTLSVELISALFKLVPAAGPENNILHFLQSLGQISDGRHIDDMLLRNNFMAAWALFGVITFLIEFFIKNRHKSLTLVSLGLSILTITLSKSAGIIFASIAVILSAIVLLVSEGKDRDTRHSYYRIAWVAAGSAGFLVLIFRRAVFEFLGKSPDMTHRSDIWRKVFSLISERPLEGWGFSGIWVPGVKPFSGLVVMNGIEYFQAHNTYLDIWLQLGIVGLALFLILLTRTFVKAWRLGVHHSNALYLWPILILVAQLVRGITESRLLIQSAMLMLLIFAVKSYDPETKLEENSKEPKLKTLSKRPPSKIKKR